MARKQRRKKYTGVDVLKVKNTEKNIKVLFTKAKLQLKRDFGDHLGIMSSLALQPPVQIRPTSLTCEGLKGT